MTSSSVCSSCSAPIGPSDRFCGTCGAVIVGTQTAASPCPACGSDNLPGITSCTSCGRTLYTATASSDPGRSEASNAGASTPPALKALQSWKLTVGMALLLAIVLISLNLSRDDEIPVVSEAPAGHDAMVHEIQDLQKAVEDDPGDPDAILRLANRLQDVKLLPKAVAMYGKYLELRPTDTNARVDLGVSFVELSFQDTTRRAEYLMEAEREFTAALRTDSGFQPAQFNLGLVHLYNGKFESANEWLQKCINTNPESEIGQRAKRLMNQHTSSQSS